MGARLRGTHTATQRPKLLSPGTGLSCLPREGVGAKKFGMFFESGPKKQPKHKVFGRDVPGTSGTQTSGYPRQKLYASGLLLLF